MTPERSCKNVSRSDLFQIVNAESGGLDGTLFSGHRTRQAITSLSYHPINGSILVAAGADGLISFYDTKSQLNVLSLTGNGLLLHCDVRVNDCLGLPTLNGFNMVTEQWRLFFIRLFDCIF